MHIALAPAVRPLRNATFAFVDVETTGFNPESDAVVELACVVVRGDRELESFSTLIDPGRPIPATASAVHHLTDAHVRGAPTLASVADELVEKCAEAVVVAHNASFDIAFLPMLAERPLLCAMRFAQLALPEAPSYKNQVLRYHLGIADARLEQVWAHRALGDAIVTRHVFAHCLKRFLAAGGADDVARLAVTLTGPLELETFRFGKHRGEPIAAIPTDYLVWLDEKAVRASRDARHTARCELARRRVRAVSA